MRRPLISVRLISLMALLMTITTMLAGCGQKGDLVRPDAPKAAPAAT